MSNLLEKLNQYNNQQFKGACEGAVIEVEDRYGVYFWHFKTLESAVEQIEALRVDNTLECHLKTQIRLVPKGEGYKNFDNEYADVDDWHNTFETYGWKVVHTEII